MFQVIFKSNSERKLGRRRTKNNLIHELSMRGGVYYSSKIIRNDRKRKTLWAACSM
jgi:hypothetical protein